MTGRALTIHLALSESVTTIYIQQIVAKERNHRVNESKLQSKIWFSSVNSKEWDNEKSKRARKDNKASHKAEYQVKLIVERQMESHTSSHLLQLYRALQFIVIQHLGVFSHLRIWQWLRYTGPPSHVSCSSPFHAVGLYAPHSGSCPPT